MAARDDGGAAAHPLPNWTKGRLKNIRNKPFDRRRPRRSTGVLTTQPDHCRRKTEETEAAEKFVTFMNWGEPSIADW